MQKVVIRLKPLVERVDLIVSSPFVRARQTADIWAEAFPKVPRVQAPELVPQSPPQAFIRWLKAHGRDVSTVMVVGHEPQLSLLGSYLIAGVDHSILEMKKSGVALLSTAGAEELGAASAELRWLLPPKVWVD